MNGMVNKVEKHYHRSDLFEDILNRLEAKGVHPNSVNRADIAGVDEFHVRGAEVSRELAKAAKVDGSKVLDVGCGLGGSCRMLADEFDCQVTGIDLSFEYIRTATNLSKLVGLDTTTEFKQANATRLPFQDNSFDLVWTQHVQMNIDDKQKFYSEICRVLDKNGIFIYYDIFKKGDAEIDYPMPWADGPEISFLMQVNEIESILDDLGLKNKLTMDQTTNGIRFFEGVIDKLKEFGPPQIGLHLLMGPSTETKITNLLNALKDGKLMLQSGIYTK